MADTIIEPLGSVVVVIPHETEEKTPGGIILPDISRHTNGSTSGTVHAVGPKVTSVKVGDKVLVPDHLGERHKIDDLDFMFFEEDELLATVSK